MATSPSPTAIETRSVLSWKAWAAPITRKTHGGMSCRGFHLSAVMDGDTIVDVNVEAAADGLGETWNPFQSLYFEDMDGKSPIKIADI
jgi:hypothetical protein